MKGWMITVCLVSFATVLLVSACKPGGPGSGSNGEGDRIRIDDSTHYTYQFDRRPTMGTVIVKVRVFDRNDARVTSMAITGDSGMPSMKGAHDSGEVPFRLNKNGDYLLPVDVVMPGAWRIRLKFTKDDRIVYRGDINFDI
jgi:hypothetical protein